MPPTTCSAGGRAVQGEGAFHDQAPASRASVTAARRSDRTGDGVEVARRVRTLGGEVLGEVAAQLLEFFRQRRHRLGQPVDAAFEPHEQYGEKRKTADDQRHQGDELGKLHLTHPSTGVRGIGPKTAAALINHAGSLDALLIAALSGYSEG